MQSNLLGLLYITSMHYWALIGIQGIIASSRRLAYVDGRRHVRLGCALGNAPLESAHRLGWQMVLGIAFFL